MRVSACLPGVVVLGAVALAGCGSDEQVRTVTVTTQAVSGGGTPTAPAPPAVTTTETVTRPPRSTTRRAPTTTASSPRTTTVTRTVPPATKTTTVAEGSPDPVGGTVLVTGRESGTGYSVRVPTGWNDGAKRFEGSGVDFDRTYVKGRGGQVTSSILIVRTAGAEVRGRSIAALRKGVERRIEDAAGGVDAVAGPELLVDGENAISFLLRRRIGDTAVVQRQIAVVRDGALFVVGLSTVRRSFAGDDRVFSAFLRSWRWA
jgi:hypothetical protein